MKLLTTIVSLVAFASATFAELIPSERLTDWTPGTKTGVVGGVFKYRPGGASERTHTGTNDTDEDAGTISGDHINVALPPYSADTTGATDAAADIQAAISHCGVGQVVYMPPGTYRIETNITMASGFNGRTLRGAGYNQTFLESAGGVIIVGSGAGISPPDYEDVLVTAGKTKGSTSLTLEGAGELWQGDLTVGKLIMLYAEHDYTVPQVDVFGTNVENAYGFSRVNQGVRIVSKSVVDADTMTVTIDPPLLEDDGGGAGALYVWRNTFQAQDIGLEDFTFSTEDSPGHTFGVTMASCYNSWIYSVHIYHAGNYPINLNCSLKCEIRKCRVSGPSNSGSNGAGILFYAHHCLIEDNVITNAFPTIEINGGSAGNAFSYNYNPDSGRWNTNHGPHNRLNLHEGNYLPGHIMSDGYYGSEDTLTLFRNNIGAGGINLKRFTRNTSVAGNITVYGAANPAGVGTPNLGNGSYVGEAQLSLGDPWNAWLLTATLTERTSDTLGVVTLAGGKTLDSVPLNGAAGQRPTVKLIWGEGTSNAAGAFVDDSDIDGSEITVHITSGTLPPLSTVVEFWEGQSGFQERDLDVEATTISKGNYSVFYDEIESLGGDTLPPSLMYNAKPNWWPTSMDWPPYDPANGVATNSAERIPAGYREINGVDPDDNPSQGKRARVGGSKTIKLPNGSVLTIGNN